MNDQELTPWFPESVRPAHAGVYETRWASQAMRPRNRQFQHWDGLIWSAWGWSVEVAEENAGNVSTRQRPEWRGLAKEPK